MLNNLIQNYFGVGIFIIIALALIFPYTAVMLHPTSTLFLFLLMLTNSLLIDWSKLKNIYQHIKLVLFANVVIFIITPFIVFLFANSLLDDDQYIYGAVFSALTPAALIAPFFTKTLKGNKELSYSILLSSMILSPIAIPIMLKVIIGPLLPISASLIFKDILLILPLPIVLAYITWQINPKVNKSIQKNGPILNFIFLGSLIFILFGTAFNKFNFNSTNNVLLIKLLILAFLQDFAIIILWGFIARKFKDKKDSLALIISVSMKNIAIAAGLLLLHSPKAALAPAIGFIAHAFLFTPIVLKKLLKSNPSRDNF
jgi:predicted Na+-dependent transporter